MTSSPEATPCAGCRIPWIVRLKTSKETGQVDRKVVIVSSNHRTGKIQRIDRGEELEEIIWQMQHTIASCNACQGDPAHCVIEENN